MKMKEGRLVGKYECFGYRYDPTIDNLVVQKDEAKIIRIIFKMALEGKNNGEIKRYLESKKYKFFDKEEWTHKNISRLLKNIKYKGAILQGKYSNRKSNIFTSNENLYYVKNHHKAIVKPEDFDKLQMMIRDRADKFNEKTNNSYSNRYPFSGIIYCGYCGLARKRTKMSTYNFGYACQKVLENGKRESCNDSYTIKNEYIEEIFTYSSHKLQKHIMKEKNFSNDVNKKLDYARKVLSDTELARDYDEELFKRLVKYIIIGGIDDSGRINPFATRIILKQESDFYLKTKPSAEYMFENKNYQTIYKSSYKTMKTYKRRNDDFKFETYVVDNIPISIEIENEILIGGVI